MAEMDESPPHSDVSRCFGVLAPYLLEFASRHALLVRKYYQNQPMWSFHFFHAKGGFGALQLHAAPSQGELMKAAVASHWWIDDEAKRQRSSVSTEPVPLEIAQPQEILGSGPLIISSTMTLNDLSHSYAIPPRKLDSSGNSVFSEFERVQRLPT
jgi:hypothetical protein